MAKQRKKPSSSLFGGNSLLILLLGLILGLGIAAAVAYFVTQVPMPFSDKASRNAPNVLLPDVRDAPDPNQALMGGGGAGTITDPDAITPPQPLPGEDQGSSLTDDIGALLATLGAATESSDNNTQASPSEAAPSGSNSPAATSGSNAATSSSRANTPSTSAAPTNPPASTPKTTYYLQAGAFRSEPDAESVRARILLMGLSAQIQNAQVNGSTLYRVRLGPFNGIDEMNRARANLSDAKIETSVVRP